MIIVLWISLIQALIGIGLIAYVFFANPPGYQVFNYFGLGVILIFVSLLASSTVGFILAFQPS